MLDESCRKGLSAPADHIFLQLDLARHHSMLEAVRQLLLRKGRTVGKVTAKLHALNMYGPGGFFRRHQDTPRGDPHFVGSLVVCLPVAHTGGGLRIQHSGRSVVYSWGEGAAAGRVQWVAFLSGCEHEVLPVEAGHRVTLEYQLYVRSGEVLGQMLRLHRAAGLKLHTAVHGMHGHWPPGGYGDVQRTLLRCTAVTLVNACHMQNVVTCGIPFTRCQLAHAQLP